MQPIREGAFGIPLALKTLNLTTQVAFTLSGHSKKSRLLFRLFFPVTLCVSQRRFQIIGGLLSFLGFLNPMLSGRFGVLQIARIKIPTAISAVKSHRFGTGKVRFFLRLAVRAGVFGLPHSCKD